jgi:anthranilate synthase component 1
MAEVVTDRETFLEAARAAPPGARVPVEVRVTVSDPFEAYRRARDGPGGVYLDTTGGQSGWGYFGVTPADFTEVDPGGDSEVHRTSDSEVHRTSDSEVHRTSDTLDALATLLDRL